MMPNVIESTIKTMCSDAIAQAVAILATKHGFDVDDAMRDLNLGDLKVVRKTSSPKATKTKPQGGEDKPKTKRGPTGYLLYTASARSETRAEMEADLEEGVKLKPQQVVTTLAAKWKALSEDERAEWNAKAKSPPPSDDEAAAEAKPEVAAAEAAPEVAAAEPKASEPKEAKAVGKKTTAPYLKFAAAIRPTVKAEMAASVAPGVALHPPNVVKEIARRWKAMDATEQAMYESADESDEE